MCPNELIIIIMINSFNLFCILICSYLFVWLSDYTFAGALTATLLYALAKPLIDNIFGPSIMESSNP